MKNLMNITQEKEQVITSRDIAELTSTEHSKVLRKIRGVLESVDNQEFRQANFGESYYINSQGKKQPQIEMTKSGSLFIASRYDVNLHLAVQLRWEELEKSLQPQIPQTFSQALLLASQQAELIERQQSKIELDAPKVEFAEAVQKSENTILLGSFAKIDGRIGQNKLFKLLRDKKILMSGSRRNEPFQCYIDRGIFELSEGVYEAKGSTYSSRTTMLTGKGQTWLKAWLDRKLKK
jgi:Rha family phage regulatory protein